ncbi:tryptorubin family RiPP precursor [Kineosporia succinea]
MTIIRSLQKKIAHRRSLKSKAWYGWI